MTGPDSAEILRDKVRSWWTSVLTGQIDQPYPVYGARIEAKLDHDNLTVVGVVPAERDLEILETEICRLARYGVKVANVDVTVAPEDAGEPGLLVQTLLVTFETEAQARFAAAYLESQSHLDRFRVKVFGVDHVNNGESAERNRQIPLAYSDEVRAATAEGHAILAVTVDETRAFDVREVLDEHTRSLRTVVLPPEPRRG